MGFRKYFIIKYYNFSSFFKRTIESYGNEYGQEEFDEVRTSIFKVNFEENESWDKCLPLKPEVVEDACDQLDVLKSVGFCHENIELRNLKYLKDKQRVCFLDFGNAIRLTGLSQQTIDEIVEDD